MKCKKYLWRQNKLPKVNRGIFCMKIKKYSIEGILGGLRGKENNWTKKKLTVEHRSSMNCD